MNRTVDAQGSVRRVCVAFSCLKSTRKQLEAKGFEKLKPDQLQDAVHRLLGRDLSVRKITRGQFRRTGMDKNGLVFTIDVVRLSRGEDIVTIGFDLADSIGSKEIRDLLTRPKIRGLIEPLGIRVNNSSQVRGVTGIARSSDWTDKESELGWFVKTTTSRNLNYHYEIVRQVVIRAALERSLLTWATGSPPVWSRWIHPASSAYRVRRWPVELLIDDTKTAEQLLALRSQFNLPKVRAEILDAARSWWTLTGSLLGFTAVALALAQLYNDTVKNLPW